MPFFQVEIEQISRNIYAIEAESDEDAVAWAKLPGRKAGRLHSEIETKTNVTQLKDGNVYNDLISNQTLE